MNNPACGTCRHWCETVHYNFAELRKCMFIQHLHDCEEWDDDPKSPTYMGNKLRPEFQLHLAFTQDASGYSSNLVTRACFSCAHYERKT